MQRLFYYISKFKGFPLNEAASKLKAIQALNVEQFIEWQDKQTWNIVRYHYDNNDFYRKKVGSRLPDKWEDLPVITKQDLQAPLHTLISRGISLKECYVSNTSGSSGHPFFFAKDKLAHAMTWAVIMDRYALYNLDFGSKQARFYGIPKEFKGYWKEKLKDVMMNRVRFSVFDLSDEMMARFLEVFKTTRFTYLYGYTNSLVLFARYLIKSGVVLKKICPSIKLCISTSELCTPEDHALLEAGFGVKHIREYGVSETCLTGFDAPDGKWRLTEETLYNEVVDSSFHPVNYGEEGTILSTSLFNKALPMIRYQVGDMGIFRDRDTSIYRSIDKLLGRTNDTALLPSGKRSPGLTFYYISRSILESSGVLKEFIIRQVALDHFVFDVVADRELTVEEINNVKEKIDLYMEPGLKLTVNRVEKIERPASGKLKHFYSELKTS